jgi:hypothetical protein
LQGLAIIIGGFGLVAVMIAVAVGLTGGGGIASVVVVLLELFGFCWYMDQRARRRG